MFDAIKSLSTKQRLFGFIFAVILTSTTTILSIYFKSSDCKPISDQYIKLSKNQSVLMGINNKLNNSYDSLFNDMLKVKGEVRKLKFSLDSIENSRLVMTRPNKLERTAIMMSPSIDSIVKITNKYENCDSE